MGEGACGVMYSHFMDGDGGDDDDMDEHVVDFEPKQSNRKVPNRSYPAK